MSAILRHHHPNRFTVLPNDAIRNPGLSFRAVGVLAHLLSLPDGARVDSATLAEAHREGRDAVRGALNELAAHGYYRREVVRLGDGRLRTEVVISSTPMDDAADASAGEVAAGDGEGAGGTGDGFSSVGVTWADETAGGTGDGFSGVGGPAPGLPTPGKPASVFQAPKDEVTGQVTFPPNPPAERGGPDEVSRSGRRRDGTTLRAVGANPRAQAASAAADAARLAAEQARAAIDADAARRRAEETASRAELADAAAEALAISGVLDDAHLDAVVERAAAGLAGPLTRSPMAVSRAVVAWCRRAAEQAPGPFGAAVDAALAADADRLDPAAPGARLVLPAPPGGTRTLRERVAGLVVPGGRMEAAS